MLEWLIAMFARFRELLEAARDRGVGPSWVWKHGLEILLALTVLAGIIKRKAASKTSVIIATGDLQRAFERVVTGAHEELGSISTDVRYPIIQDLLRKKVASNPTLKVFCYSQGVPTQSMVEHMDTILREFPTRTKGPKQNIFIAVLESLPAGVNVCFNEQMVVITSDVHTVLGSDCLAIVSTDRDIVNLARSRAISLYRQSRVQIRCPKNLRVVVGNTRGTTSHQSASSQRNGVHQTAAQPGRSVSGDQPAKEV